MHGWLGLLSDHILRCASLPAWVHLPFSPSSLPLSTLYYTFSLAHPLLLLSPFSSSRAHSLTLHPHSLSSFHPPPSSPPPPPTDLAAQNQQQQHQQSNQSLPQSSNLQQQQSQLSGGVSYSVSGSNMAGVNPAGTYMVLYNSIGVPVLTHFLKEACGDALNNVKSK